MIEPHERLLLLREHHLPNLTEIQSRVLAARACGFKAKAIGERLFREERAVRRILEGVEEQVGGAVGGRRDAALLATWFWNHIACRYRCAAAANEMFAIGAVFPPENKPGNAPEKR